MWNPRTDDSLQKAIRAYTADHGLYLTPDVEYDVCIDGVDICVDGYPVLLVGLPPVSNYGIRQTRHTLKFMREKHVSAV